MTACDLTSLTTASSCFNCLSETEKKRALVMFLALALKKLGGTDLTNVNTLRSAVVAFKPVAEPTLDSFDLQISQTLANNVGAPAALTINQIKTVIACYCGISKKELHAMETVLRCQLTAYNA